MRLFAAVIPPQQILDEIEAAVVPLRKDATVRWTPQDMWHVTCAFYGEVEVVALPELSMRLAQVAERTAVGSLSIRNATEFNGRVLALELAGGVDELTVLADRCTSAGRASGLQLEHRRFRPHVTIARASRPRDLSHLVLPLIGAQTSAWQPSELVLVRSHLGEHAHYEHLEQWPLATAGLY